MLTPQNHMTDDLLVSYLLNEADENTRQLVEQWIGEDPEHRRYFDHFSIIWETSKTITLPDTIDPQAAWQRFKKRTEAAEKQVGISKKRKATGLLKIAASIILVLGILTVSYVVWNKTGTEPIIVAAAEKTAINTLPDGSVVTLNKQSTITYAAKFKGDERRIKLKGEAFFDVKADKQKPFVVEADDVTITVLGTSFNIKNIDGQVEVIVETGSVIVAKNNKTIIVKEKEKVVIENDAPVLEKDSNPDKLYNYYRTNEFVCDNTPLWKLVEVLNDTYQANIIIGNKELTELPLTTTFYNESLDNILNIISETFNITIEKKADTIILK